MLKWNEKKKLQNGLPLDDIPRLVCYSGRTEQAIHSIANDLKSRTLDAEFVGLLHNVFKYVWFIISETEHVFSDIIASFADMTLVDIVTEDTVLFLNRERYVAHKKNITKRRRIFILFLVILKLAKVLEKNSYNCLYFLILLAGKIIFYFVL